MPLLRCIVAFYFIFYFSELLGDPDLTDNIGTYSPRHLTQRTLPYSMAITNHTIITKTSCIYFLSIACPRLSLSYPIAEIRISLLITSRFNNCNSFSTTGDTELYSISAKDHIVPLIQHFHGLPIEQLILFKLLVLTYKSLHILICLLIPLRSLTSPNNTVPPLHARSTRI